MPLPGSSAFLSTLALKQPPQSGGDLVSIWPNPVLQGVDLAAQFARPLPQPAATICL